MIPQQIAEFITQFGLPMAFGTRDASLQTTVSRAFAMRISNNSENISFVFPKIAMSERHLANLQHNGRVAFTIGHSASHVCYQFKGKYISHQENIPEDLELLGKNFSVFEDLSAKEYGEQVREIFKNMNLGNDYLTVSFTVEEIFNQTPGPGAGKKIE